jgi:arginyl-tRNA synthetase
MQNIIQQIQAAAAAAVYARFQQEVNAADLQVTPTKKEHQGDYTLVTFSLSRQLKLAPPQIAAEIADFLRTQYEWIAGVEVIQGFVNVSLSDAYWTSVMSSLQANPSYWKPQQPREVILVEFSSPNTNKPLHLGHIRNILLGWSMYKILDVCGHDVKRVQIVNDRGIAICKSMVAWDLYGGGMTPEAANTKSDHFVGEWYVRFEKEFQKEYKAWQSSPEGVAAYSNRKQTEESETDFFKNYKNQYFNTASQLGQQARELLLRWEANDGDTIALWKRMNNWVYAGFNETYEKLDVTFDKLYFESDTYLLGKDLIEEGLAKSVFYKKEDGSVWVDLTEAGLDHKLLLRRDGTSVYMTQDLGTAHKRFEEFGATRMIYVVADEQNYHFQALFAIMAKLGAPYALGLHHLSYGMVDLPEGKMKSREGTVVDADDLIADVIAEAGVAAQEREVADEEIVRRIGMAALKFFIIKVDPRKRMTFDPKASVDMQGQTGPYIQNAYVRIQSILRKAGDESGSSAGYTPLDDEKMLLNMLTQSTGIIESAAREYSPALIANYAYALAKEYHRYYHDVKVIQAESDAARHFRLALIRLIADMLRQTMDLLGIEMPERM